MHRAVAVLALLTLACGSIDINVDVSSSDNALADTEWRLTSLGAAADPIPVVSGSELTAQFSQEEISGSTGCNSYHGDYSVSDGSSINTEDLSWTEVGCPSDELWEQEEIFLDLLVAAESFVLFGDQLVISGEEGKSVLVFTRSQN